jgi:hypothetical protein
MKLIMENWERFLNEEGLTEDEGPEQAISRWAQMFPRAAAALEAAGVALENLAIAASQDPEMDLTVDASPLAPLGTHPGDPGVAEE